MLLLRCDEENFLEINVLRRKYPDTNNYWDINWLDVSVRISASDFKADYCTNLRTDELKSWYDALVSLKNSTGNEAELSSMEGGLCLHCVIRRTGRFDCKGTAKNFFGDKLEFSLSADNQVLYDVLSQLERLLKDYPVLGSRTTE